MYYLNLPLKIWKYVILFIILITLVIGYVIYRRQDIKPFQRILAIWLILLLVLNFINMYYTINNYIKYSTVVGNKGPKGVQGPRGYRGNSFICNMCGDGGKVKEDVYGSNVNDNDQIVENEKLMAGKCKFPFIHNNEFQYDCTTEPREDGILNDANVFGWCATNTNNDLSYKTFGYCKNSDIEKRRFESRKTRASELSNYQTTNYGVLDVDIITSNLSEAKCPNGYEMIPTDLNENTTGKYIYMCVKKGLDDFGIGNLNVVLDGAVCPEKHSLIDRDLNAGTNGQSVKICKEKVNKNFIKDIKIQNTQKCPNGYDLVDGNLNHSIDGSSLYICVNKDVGDSEKKIDMAFIYGKDNQLYFFRDDMFWKYNDKTQRAFKNYPMKINQMWGKLPKQLDAAMTYPYDNETYFFKGDIYWKYDPQKGKIAGGYPKTIKSNWVGIPDNLDAIYIKNRKVYFIKKNLYFLYDDKNKKVKAGYPKKLNNKFPYAPDYPTAVVYYPYKERTFYIIGNQVKIYKNQKEISDSPKPLSDVFMGII